MTPNTTPPTTDNPALSDDDRSFEAWRRTDRALSGFPTVASLRAHLWAAAASRAPDRVLTALGRIAEADPTNDLARFLYMEAFTFELDALTRAVVRKTGAKYDPTYVFAGQVLGLVAHEATFWGEAHSGKTLMSRTWARMFIGVQTGRPARIRGELIALFARSRSAARSFCQSLAGRSLFGRFVSRLAPLDEVIAIGKVSPVSETFDADCIRRSIPPSLARRQADSYAARLPVYNHGLEDFEAAINAVVEELLQQEAGSER
jgi:hypothetical protein